MHWIGTAESDSLQDHMTLISAQAKDEGCLQLESDKFGEEALSESGRGVNASLLGGADGSFWKWAGRRGGCSPPRQ